MSEKINVKVNLREFTYKDKKGYHTVVGYGEVPSDNQEIIEAIKRGWIERMKTETKSESKKEKSKSRK